MANVEELAQRHFNSSVSNIQHSLLEAVVKAAPRPTKEAHFEVENDFTLVDCFDWEELFWHVKRLIEGGLATVRQDGTEVWIQLTLEGWNQAQPLPNPGGDPRKCFVAMWFDDSMTEPYELGIRPAIEESGYQAIRLDHQQFNRQITDQMLAEIRDSRIMVADFTGNRGGAYYEAGFAKGLGREVIYTCHHEHFGDRHFDIAGENCIKWISPADLRTQLANRILGAIGRPKS